MSEVKYLTDAELKSRLDEAITQYAGDAIADLLGHVSRKIAKLQDDKRYLIAESQAIEEALYGWPKLPSTTGLWSLSARGSWPEDWERGKAMQRELSMERIPYKAEYELAAGFWDRITNGAWRTVEDDDLSTPEQLAPKPADEK